MTENFWFFRLYPLSAGITDMHQILRLFGAGSLTQGFVFDRQALFQNFKKSVSSKGMM